MTFDELLSLKPNWDSYGAKAIDQETCERAGEFFEQCCVQPSVVPMSDGGVQLEWHRNGQDLEIEFHPNGQDVASWEGSPAQALALIPGLSGRRKEPR